MHFFVMLTVLFFFQLLVEEDRRVRNCVPEVFPETLMVLHFEKVDEAISPGLTVLRWSSLGVDKYIAQVYAALSVLEKLISRVTNILEVRIESELKIINKTTLCQLPDGDPWTPGEFLQKTTVGV